MASCMTRRCVLSAIAVGIILILQLKDINASEIVIEPDTVTWDEADKMCRNSGYTLFPGRRYRGKEILALLADGQTAWLYGWRLVSDVGANSKGRLKTLKVDQSRKSSTAIPFVCKTRTDSSFYYPLDKANTITEARDFCTTEGYDLATVETEDEIRDLLDTVIKDKPHWLESVTTQGSFMKQCLAVQKGRTPEYFYDKCNTQYNFICHRDPKLIQRFATMAALKLVRQQDIQNVIDEGPTLIQSSTELVPEPTSTLDLISPTPSLLFSEIMSSTVEAELSSTVVKPEVTPESSTYTSSSVTDLTSSSPPPSSSSSVVSTPALILPSVPSSESSSFTEPIMPSSATVMSEINTDMIITEPSSDLQLDPASTVYPDLTEELVDLVTMDVSDDTPSSSSVIASIQASVTSESSVSDVYVEPSDADVYSSPPGPFSTDLYVPIVDTVSTSATMMMTAVYNDTAPSSSMVDVIDTDMVYPPYQSSTEPLMTVYITASPTLNLQNSSRADISDHIKQTISSFLQSATPILTEVPIVIPTDDYSDMPIDTSETGLYIPSSAPPDETDLLISPTSTEVSIDSTDVYTITTDDTIVDTIDEIIDEGDVTDPEEEEEYINVETNESDRKATAPEDEGWDTGLWVAFIILIIAVIASLVIAFILYRKRKNSKSKTINGSVGAGTGAAAATGGAGPAPTTANDVELRENRSASKSPPRDSTTFKDNAYDL